MSGWIGAHSFCTSAFGESEEGTREAPANWTANVWQVRSTMKEMQNFEVHITFNVIVCNYTKTECT